MYLHWEPTIIVEGVTLPDFVCSILGMGEFLDFSIKVTALAFKTRYGEGVGPQNQKTKNSRSSMGLSPLAKN